MALLNEEIYKFFLSFHGRAMGFWKVGSTSQFGVCTYRNDTEQLIGIALSNPSAITAKAGYTTYTPPSSEQVLVSTTGSGLTNPYAKRLTVTGTNKFVGMPLDFTGTENNNGWGTNIPLNYWVIPLGWPLQDFRRYLKSVVDSGVSAVRNFPVGRKLGINPVYLNDLSQYRTPVYVPSRL